MGVQGSAAGRSESTGLVVCELRYIDSYRLRLELERPMPSLFPLERAAGMVVHGPDGIPVGNPAMLLSILWGELKLPYQPGTYTGVPLLMDGYFVTYGGFRVQGRILADYRVESRVYVSELLPQFEGLYALAHAGTPLNARMLGRWISPCVIRRTWRHVETVQRTRRQKSLRLTVLDAIA